MSVLDNYLSRAKLPPYIKDFFKQSYDSSASSEEDYVTRIKSYEVDFSQIPSPTNKKYRDWFTNVKRNFNVQLEKNTTTSKKTTLESRVIDLEKSLEEMKTLIKESLDYRANNIVVAPTQGEYPLIDIVKGSDIVVMKAKKYNSVIEKFWDIKWDTPFNETVNDFILYLRNERKFEDLNETKTDMFLKTFIQLIDQCILNGQFLDKLGDSLKNGFKVAITEKYNCDFIQSNDRTVYSSQLFKNFHTTFLPLDEGLLLNVDKIKNLFLSENVENVTSIHDSLILLISILLHDIFHIMVPINSDFQEHSHSGKGYQQFKEKYILNTTCNI